MWREHWEHWEHGGGKALHLAVIYGKVALQAAISLVLSSGDGKFRYPWVAAIRARV